MAFVVRLLSALGLVATAAAMSLPAQAADMKSMGIPGTFSANAGLVTEYRFRGLDQSDEKPAFQGGIDWSMDTGFKDTSVYLGTWGSSVDFNDGNSGSDGNSGHASIETDWYGGVRGTGMYGIGYDVGLIYFAYPGASSKDDYNYLEFQIGLSKEVYKGVTVGVNYNFSNNFFADSGKAHWFAGNVSYALPINFFKGVTVDASLGHQSIQNNTKFGTKDYTTWSFGATLGLTDNVSLGVQYVDTNLDENTNAFGTPAVIGSLSASF